MQLTTINVFAINHVRKRKTKRKNAPNLFLNPGEITSKGIAESLGLLCQYVSKVLSCEESGAPRPIRYHGTVRIYAIEQIQNWKKEFPSEEDFINYIKESNAIYTRKWREKKNEQHL